MDTSKPSTWSGKGSGQIEIAIIASNWDTSLWFYRNLLGATQKTPFVETKDKKPLWVRLSFYSILITIINGKYLDEFYPGFKGETPGKIFFDVLVPDKRILEELIELLDECKVPELYSWIKYNPLQNEALQVQDPDGNILVFQYERPEQTEAD